VSLLCLCLTSSRFEDNTAQLERYRTYIDMAELRIDLLRPEDRNKIVELPERFGIPFILTIRLPEDGGSWGLNGETEYERTALFEFLLESGGWTYVDLEFNRPMESVLAAAASSGVEVIRSIHDFQGTLLNQPLSEISETVRKIADRGAIPKLAAVCTGSRQLLTLAQVSSAVEGVEKKILLGMDDFGIPSRILAERFGSLWTYSSAVGGPGKPVSAAPGQLDPKTLSELYSFRDIDASTALYGVTGNPIAHSRSPEFHNRWLQKSGLNGVYIPILSDDISLLADTCDILGITGLSVTVPYKQKALEFSSSAGSAAESIGAANTLIRNDKGWKALNTDAEGFMKSLIHAMNLESVKDLKGKTALIIGAGGAARAAVHALYRAGMNLVILNRTVEKARRLAEESGQQWGSLSEDSKPLLEEGVDLAVQTTTVGMYPDCLNPIPWWNPGGCSLVYDMIYEPEETALLALSRAAGVITMNGLGMLEAQGRIQFELFTGFPPAI